MWITIIKQAEVVRQYFKFAKNMVTTKELILSKSPKETEEEMSHTPM
jgi:hypothetical protein